MQRTIWICFLLCLIHSINAQRCPNGTLYRPSPGTSFYWDLTPEITVAAIQAASAQVFDLDMFYITPEMVSLIHSRNQTLFCYIDTTYEPFRPDASKFVPSVLGKEMDGWPGQRWVDIQSPIVRQIMADRLQIAVNLGCDGIEWDDVDAYTNDNGFHLGPNDQLNFNLYLANITHNVNMSAGLKNDIDQIYLLDDYFDWALNEQCYQFKECDTLQPFIGQNKAVFGAEYKGKANKICSKLNALDFSFIRTDIDVHGAMGVPCCQFSTPPCPQKEYWCGLHPRDYPVYPDDDDQSGTMKLLVSIPLAAIVLVLSVLL